ncbi:hypothetical protein GRI89_16605 [Altererythrobacter salegens]|uniref:Calcineurin-like phosphoesterase domain-containing protein n=1 Tax=Croceibacterium salegens TaxID=1737568 RepID=A0A6I4T1H3_9SPHN|nr:metallophosphoesterase [Croceibacterium salegens]MXO61166.1 hypothetical protein [Croceibacterium salegens]
MAKMARWMLAVLALCVLGPAASGEAGPAAPRIVAVGDLHGDFAAFLDIVEAAGVADAGGRWTGGKTTFVQLGDVPDRGADSLKIIRFLQKLEKAAPRAGGKTILLVGNHEAMNVTGDLRYVSAGEYAAFADGKSKARRDRLFDRNSASIIASYKEQVPDGSIPAIKRLWEGTYPLGKIEHRLAWAPKGEIGMWVMSHPAVAEIDGTLFVHGGLSVEYSVRPIAEINKQVRAALASDTGEEPSILTDPHGPLWYRGNVSRAGEDETERKDEVEPPSIEDELAQVLAAYGAKRLVVAHTPDLNGIEASNGGRLVRVDTGISSVYGGPRSYLEITGGKALAWRKTAEGKWESMALPSPD